MDPVTAGTLISAGSSLLGGLFGGKKEKAEWVTPNYKQIRKKAEAAGFNPLTALSMNAGQVGYSTSGGGWGQALANAATGISDGLTQSKKIELEQTALDQRDRELDLREKSLQLAAGATSPSRLPSISGKMRNPAMSQTMPVTHQISGNPVDTSGSKTKHLENMGDVAPDREGEVLPVTSGAGVTVINSRATSGQDIYVPGDAGEPWGIDEVATAVAVGLPQMIWKGAKSAVPAYQERKIWRDKLQEQYDDDVQAYKDEHAPKPYVAGTDETRDYLENYDFSAGQLPPFGFAH